MSFKSEDAPTVSAEQANDFFNDDVSVSLFTELAKSDEKPSTKEEETSLLPNNISESDDEDITPATTTDDDDETAPSLVAPANITEREVNHTSLELPKEWQEALEKEFNSENPSLIGWEGEDGKFVIPKTFDELKELINENKKFEVEENKKKWEQDTVEGLSPQVQSIMEYAKAGGKDVTTLLEAWATVESISQLDPRDINDAEELVRYDLEAKGLNEDDIEEQVDLLKSSGKILQKAVNLKPKLEQQEVQRIAEMEALQKQRAEQLQQNKVRYQTNMSQAIDKTFSDKNISGVIKHSIFEPVYESAFRPGMRVTGFQRGLEELQLDPSKNEHFAEVALLVSDRDKFFEVYGNKIKRDVTADTVKKLKFSKNTNQTADDEVSLNQPKKLKGFRAPWKD
jgi:hypothetical protein